MLQIIMGYGYPPPPGVNKLTKWNYYLPVVLRTRAVTSNYRISVIKWTKYERKTYSMSDNGYNLPVLNNWDGNISENITIECTLKPFLFTYISADKSIPPNMRGFNRRWSGNQWLDSSWLREKPWSCLWLGRFILSTSNSIRRSFPLLEELKKSLSHSKFWHLWGNICWIYNIIEGNF